MVRRAHLLPLLPLVTFNQLERMIETILLYKHESVRCERQENEETPPRQGIRGGLSISLQVHITSASKAISCSLNTNCTNRLLSRPAMGCGETHTDSNTHMLRSFIEVKVIICTDEVLLLNVPLSFGIVNNTVWLYFVLQPVSNHCVCYLQCLRV